MCRSLHASTRTCDAVLAAVPPGSRQGSPWRRSASAPDYTYRPDLVSRGRRSRRRRRSRSRTASVRRRAGATALRSLHATSSSRTARSLRKYAPPDVARMSPRGPQRSRGRCEDRQRRPSSPLAGLARPLPVRSCRAHALCRSRTSRRSGATASTTRRPGEPIGTGPFLVERWERGTAARPSCATRATGGRIPATSTARHPLLSASCVAPATAEVLECVAARRGRRGRTQRHRVFRTRRRLRRTGASRSSRRPARWEHFDYPPRRRAVILRSRSKLVRQALAYGIDRAALARSVCSARSIPSSGRSTAPCFLNSSRYYRPNWTRLPLPAARARRLLEQAGCRRGADGIYVCGGRAAVASLRRRSADRRAAARSRARRRRSFAQVGIEVVPVVRAASVLFEPDAPGGDFDVAIVRVDQRRPASAGQGDLTAAAASRTAPATASGSSRRDLDQAQRILDEVSRRASLNRADAQLAKDVPVIPLFQIRLVLAYTAAVRNVRLAAPVDTFWNAEDWWLDD